MIFGVKKFHQYLYGRKFTLITDHKPLTTIIFGPKCGIPPITAARLQPWTIQLAAYSYDLLVIDAHSEWGEVFPMNTTTTTKTLDTLRLLFSAYGLPEQIVSDNGPQFTSDDFYQFMTRNGICHQVCSIRTFKEAMKAGVKDGLSWNQRMANFLLTYQTTPHASTQQSPCSLFLQRELRTHLNLLTPNVQEKVEQEQTRQKERHDKHARQRTLFSGQPVMVKNLRPGDTWIPGVVLKQLGPVSYLVDVSDGRTWRRHIDHLKIRNLPEPMTELSENTDEQFLESEVAVEPPIMPAVHGQTTDLSSEDSLSPMDNRAAIVPEAHVETNRDSSDLPAQTEPPPMPRRSTHIHHPPDYLRPSS